VYIPARLVIVLLSSLLPAPFGDASTKVRNFESFSIQVAACASEGTLSFNVLPAERPSDRRRQVL
jgi:hypothetical protein